MLFCCCFLCKPCCLGGLPDISLQSQLRLWDSPWAELQDDQNGVNSDEDVSGSHAEDLDGTSEHRKERERKAARRKERINRRMRRAVAREGRGGPNTIGTDKDLPDHDGSFGTLQGKRSRRRLIRARDAKPCSYCHVPYHHRLAPFTNMKVSTQKFQIIVISTL